MRRINLRLPTRCGRVPGLLATAIAIPGLRRGAPGAPPRLRTLQAVFIAIAAPTLLAFALLTPPGYVPDEAAHVVRAASLLRGELVGERAGITKPNGHPGQDRGRNR